MSSLATSGPEGEGRAPRAAALLAGFAAALVSTTLPDAVLLPAVDRWPPRHLGLAVLGALFSAGWWWAAGTAGRTWTRRAQWWLTGLVVAGGFLAAALLPWWREVAALGLRGQLVLPYYPHVALVAAGCALPLAPALGVLLGLLTGDGRRDGGAALLVGLGVGWLVGAWFAEVLLGPGRSLQVAALLAGTAGILLAEQGERRVSSARLADGAGAALLLVGAVLLVAGRQLVEQLDRGALPAAALAACTALVAAAATRLPPRRTAALWLGVAALATTCLLPATPSVPRVLERSQLADAGQVALVALLPGLGLGLLLRSRGAALRLACVPAALVLLAPLLSFALLPRLGPRGTALLLAVPVLLAALARRPRPRAALGALLGVAIASLSGLGPRPGPQAVLATASVRTTEGHALLVRDALTQRDLVAIDGRAPFGRSDGQERRFAHLPILMHGPPARVLVVSSGGAEAARAAWMHGPVTLHWLQPYPTPSDWDPRPWPGSDPPTSGSERQFLSTDHGSYDVIVLAPDARADRRTALTGTVEFFELARRRLVPGGTLCQWYDLADVDITDLKAVMASALRVFPHAYLISDHPRTRRAALGLLLRDEELTVPPSRVDEILRRHPEVTADFEEIGVDGLGIACMVFADRGLIELVAPLDQALRDERAVVAVRSALRADGSSGRLRLGLEFMARYRRDPMPWVGVLPDEIAPVSAIVRDRFKSWQHLLGGTRAVVWEAGPAGRPFDEEDADETPPVEADALIDALAGLPDWVYLRERILGLAERLERQGDPGGSEHLLRRAIACDLASAELRFALASLVERRGDRETALVLHRTVLAFDPGHVGARAAVAELEAGR